MYDFESIILTRPEQKALHKFIFHKRIHKDKLGRIAYTLADFGLIKRTYSGVINEFGEQLLDDTYELTDLYFRYRKYRWQRIATPVLISVISSVITATVTSFVTVLVLGK